jgi:hypothetical protein
MAFTFGAALAAGAALAGAFLAGAFFAAFFAAAMGFLVCVGKSFFVTTFLNRQRPHTPSRTLQLQRFNTSNPFVTRGF